MEWIQDRNNRIPFSLHDSRIKKITIQNNTLTLKLDKVFQYTKDKETIYSGDLIFNDSDLDECSVFILDRIVYEGDFSGKAISLKEYMNQFSNLEFEILTEGYFGYSTTYTGWFLKYVVQYQREGEIKGLSADVDQEVKEAYDKFLIEGGYEF